MEDGLRPSGQDGVGPQPSEGAIRCVFLPGDGGVSVGWSHPSEIGQLVGGHPEVVVVDREDTAVHINAYGKSTARLAPNDLATRVVEELRPGFARWDFIAGPALVVGVADDGSPTHVPADVQELVQHVTR